MQYSFSDRISNLHPSAIREILKNSDPNVISLAAGNPAVESFPVAEMKEIADHIFDTVPGIAFQYGITEGYPKLRELVMKRQKEKYGIGTDNDDIMIISGGTQAMDLSTKVLVNEGDVILSEDPAFVGALNTFRSYKVRLRGVPMEKDGMDMQALEKALQEEKTAKFIYTIPNFQNPSGITMSWEKRKQLYELAKKYGVMILEDNPYGDLRFAGEHVPAIKSLDEEGIVMYAGTFSKVISPGIRVGYGIGPKPVLQKMIVCKQGEDVHTGMLSQIICDEFMTRYDYDAHLAGLKDIYRKKSDIMLEQMEKHLRPLGIDWNPIEGGLFLWCKLPEGVDMPAFCKAAVLN